MCAGVQKRAEVMEELGNFFEQVGHPGWLGGWVTRSLCAELVSSSCRIVAGSGEIDATLDV